MMRDSAFGNEVSQGLGFDCCARFIFNAEIYKLISPISDAARFVFFLQNLLQRLAGPDDDLVGLEVWFQFPARHHDCK